MSVLLNVLHEYHLRRESNNYIHNVILEQLLQHSKMPFIVVGPSPVLVNFKQVAKNRMELKQTTHTKTGLAFLKK